MRRSFSRFDRALIFALLWSTFAQTANNPVSGIAGAFIAGVWFVIAAVIVIRGKDEAHG